MRADLLGSGMRRRSGRMARRLTCVVVLALLLATAPPPDNVAPSGPGWPSLAWLRSWIGETIAWAGPHTPPTPKQETGTAAGKAHAVPASATRAAGGAGGPAGVGKGQLPAYSRHQRASKPYTTPAIPGFDAQKSKRIASAASATSDVYQNPDGSYTRKVYGGPVNYRAADGSWTPIDTTLGTGSDSRLHEKANSLGVDFAGSGADATLATLRVDGGHAVTYSLQGAAPVPASVSGSTVTYSGVLPSTDLTLTTVATGIKEALVLHSVDAPTSWVFPLTVQGMTPRLAGDGAAEFVDSAGAVAERIPPGYMMDSYVDAKSGNHHESRAVTYSLVTAAGGPALKVDIDGTWLRDSKRVFPVTVDPTFTASSSTFGENGQTQDNSGLPELRSGTYDSGADEARPFLKFDNFGSTYAGQRMTAVNLDLFDIWAWTCTPEPFSVSPVTSAWTASAILGWPGPSVGTSIGSLTANPGAACTNTSLNLNTGVWMAVPLSVATFNSWTGGGTNNGLAVVASTTDNTQWKKFASVNTTHAPYLDITYTANVPPQVDNQYPPDNYVATTLTPELLASGHDPDNYPNASVQYSFTVYNSAGAQVASSGLISSGDYVVPAGTLTWSQNYAWTVQTYDGYSYSPSPVVNQFSTPVPQPLITSGLAQNAPDHGYDPSIGNYTTSATDARVDTVGPSLSVDRDYNSLDPRVTGAFGAGWSSVFDAKATEQTDGAGNVTSVVVTYPNGQEVAYGRNANGSFTPPSGRFATFASVTGGGYTLTDKNDTVYKFTQPTGTSGVYGITSVTDAAGRAETFAYTGSQVTTATSATSGRALHLTWSTPTGATTAHVATVVTDPATAGNPSTALTWTYSYGGDQLTGVCPPTSSTACTTYTYTGMSQYPNAVMNTGPHSYWRLGEGSGSTAASSVLVNEGADNALYTNVTLGQPGPLPGSTATAAGFNGLSSYVKLPSSLVSNADYETISLWFKTSTPDGVLFDYQTDPMGGPYQGSYTPALYVGTDGKLLGQFWTTSGIGPITTATAVTDGAWHHVVLTGAGNTQSMYLDGALVGSKSGLIQLYDATGSRNEYLGAGLIGGAWPDEKYANTTNVGSPEYLNGSVSDVAFYNQYLTAASVGRLYASGHIAANVIASVTRPSGQTYAQVAYDTVAGRVSQVTDENGATWKLSAPTVTGSSQVYASSVMGSAPQDYWRLGEAAAAQAVNQVKGGTATYSTVTLGVAGAFGVGDDTAASFNGTSSYVQLPGSVAPSGASSVELWFNTTQTGGILHAVQNTTMGTGCTTCMPTLWVGSDGKLRGLSPSTTPTGKFGGTLLTGKCMDDALGGTANGTKVWVYDCNGSAPQNWTLYPDGTVRNYGKCLDLSGYGTTNGTLVQLWDCTGASNQVWQPYNGGLRNPVSGRCLDDPSSSTTNGTQFQLYDCNATNAQQWLQSLASPTRVDDGKWHHVVLTSTGTTQALYLDGGQVDSTTGTVTLTPGSQPYAYLGAGYTGVNWGGLPANTTASFNGTIDEAAFYRSALSGADVARHYAAYKSSSGVAPVSTVTVTDPGNKTITYAYDALNGNRPISQTDALGNKTTYGYDTSGFENTVTDPNGVVTTTGHDVRGNVVSQVTCQNQAVNACSTVYYTYYPDDTSSTLTPDARNDLLLTTRDGRSASATDNTYLTSYSYDTAGNRTVVTTPPVDGFSSGRTSTAAYTDGTTVAAADGGFAPAGLPAKAGTPAGATSTMTYFKNGDLAQVTDAAGQVTKYTYDSLGRTLTKTVVSDSFPNGLVTSYRYDGLGQVVSETDPAVTNRVTGAVHTPVTSTVYNADGEVTSQTVADATGGDASRTVSSTYNSRGQMATSTDANGKTTTLSYDTYGNKVKDVDAALGETDFAYDAEGHLLTTTLVNYTGDPTNPSPARNLVESSRAYDPAGRLASITDSMGWVTSYTYTDNGLPATITRSDPAHGTSFVEESNGYDAAGNLASKTTNNGATTTTYTVDAANRTTSSTLDPQGLARTTSYVFSPDDAVVTTTLSGPSGTTQTSDATYDPMGRVTSRVVHNGSAAPVGRWKLNETSGTTAFDSSGAHLNAQVNGAVTWSTAHGGSAAFPGSSSAYLSTPTPVVDTSQSFTVSAWVYLTSTAQTGLAVSEASSQQPGFDLCYDQSTNHWAFARWSSDTPNAATRYTAFSTSTPAVNTWTHLVGTFDRTTGSMTLYVNGVAEGTATDPTPFQAKGGLNIGRGMYNGSAASPWYGSVADVQVYSQALSASQASGIYGGTVPAAGATVLRTAWALDQRGLPTSMTDPNGNTTGYAYDEGGRLSVTTAPTVNTEVNGGTPVATHPVTTVGYDTFGNQTETSDPDGNVTTTGYDAEGQVVSTRLPNYTPPGSTTPITATSTRSYDNLGRLASETDPLGHQTSYTYDQLGDVATETAPNAGVTHYTYDTNGHQLSVTDAMGAQTQETYDYLGNRITATQVERQPTSAAYTTTYAYASAGGWLSSVTSPAGVATSYGYDAAGETTSVTDGANNTTTYQYDPAGHKVATILPDGTKSTVTYDMAGRPTATASLDASGATLAARSAAYDADGNKTASTDARGNTSTFTYDATGMVSGEIQPVSATSSISTSFGYDAAGNRTRFTDGRGNAFLSTYNSWNLPESRIEPATPAYPNLADRTFTTTYDAAGRVASQQLPGGVSVSNSYDNVGNLTGQTGSGAEAATTARSFGYDSAGRLTSVSAGLTSDSFSYNDRGLLLSASGPSGASSFGYTTDGLMSSRTDAAGTTTYSYDTAGRLSTLADAATGTQLTYAYNKLSQVSQIAYGSGGNVRSFGYDGLHRLTSDRLATNIGATVASISYGYDANGNLTSKNTTGFTGSASNTYTYDQANRLTSWSNGTTTVGYGYDASGNRTQVGAQTFTYDARDELTSDGAHNYTYTARGTLSATTGATPATSTSDAFGQTITQGPQSYSYDGLGRVLSATTSGGGSVSLSYTGAGNTLASDGSATYSRDPAGALVGIHTPTGSVLAYTDQHTDVVGDFTATGASLSGSTTYDPLGNVTATANQAGSLGFQSEWTDHSTGRVNMLSRWYNPATGQFDNHDSANLNPVPNSVSANPFAYVNDNPLAGTDPTGMCSWYDVVCGVESVAHAAVSFASSAWDYLSSEASSAWDDAITIGRRIYDTGAQIAHQVVTQTVHYYHQAAHRVYDGYRWASHRLTRAVHNFGARAMRTIHHYRTAAVHMIKSAYHQAKGAVRSAYHRATTAASHAYHQAATAVKAGYHAAASAVKAGVQYVAHHAAAIASFVASTAVFIGCDAALGMVTAGVGAVAGAVACGALAGAVGNAVGYAVGAAKSGKFSWSALGKTALTGAAVGAAGGVLGAAGGKILSAVGGKFAGAVGGLLRTGAEDAGAEASSAADEGASEAASAAESGLHSGSEAKEPTSCTLHSFAPDTVVMMADGSTKAIKDIHLGDTVKATDPKTGKTKAKPVVILHDNHDTDMADVTVATANGTNTVLHTTQHHPFWDATANQWVQAANLKPGHRLRNLAGAALTIVLSVATFTAPHDMRDLTIADTHTYYVVAGDTPVLVHNCGGSTNSHLDGLPVHEDINKFNVRAGELVDNRFETHPINEMQMQGGETVGHGGVANLSNEELIMPGGPQGNDPIRGTRDWAPGDCSCYPGSRVIITGGHHRTAEVARRVAAGEMDPSTLIEFVISPP